MNALLLFILFSFKSDTFRYVFLMDIHLMNIILLSFLRTVD